MADFTNGWRHQVKQGLGSHFYGLGNGKNWLVLPFLVLERIGIWALFLIWKEQG